MNALEHASGQFLLGQKRKNRIQGGFEILR